MELPTAYRYWAFISYSHHDRRVANLLVDRLSNAKVPKPQRARVIESRAHFAPVFLDTREAAASPRLDEELQIALRASAKLIVLCSPFSAQSKHVADEIRYFQEIGRSADILCLIVSGVPNASAAGNAALECFPPPLLLPSSFKEAPPPPLAATLGEETETQWQHAVDQLSAGMLGVQLEHRRTWLERQRRFKVIASVASVVAVAAVVYGTAWAFWLPQEIYAKHSVQRWEAWEPINIISAETASRRPQSLKFRRRGAFAQWTEVRWVDGQGQCANEGPPSMVGEAFKFQCTRSKACGVRLGYVGGKLTSEQVFDQYDQPIETLTYNVPKLAVLNEAVIGCSRRPGDIEFISLERQLDGPLAGVNRTLKFRGGEDKSPRPNSTYAFGFRIDYDAYGRIAQRSLLDERGAPSIGSSGYAAIRYKYNEAGDLVEETTVGIDGQPVEGREGYATVQREVDAFGRLTLERYLDGQSRPVHDQYGVYGVRQRWNDRGQLLETAYNGVDGQPWVSAQGVSFVRHAYKDGGEQDREAYFDAQLRPALHGTNGCEVTETTTPRDQLWSEVFCFGSDGKPRLSAAGWHVKRITYSATGQELVKAYFGVDHKPTMCTDTENACPLHGGKNQFDERGNRVRSRFFGLKGESMLAGTGAAGVDLIYNARNRLQRWINIGLDGKPVRAHKGNVATEKLYDSYGRVVEERKVDAEGKPMALISLDYADRYTYDAFGNQVKIEILDIAGRHVSSKEGYAIRRSRFDSRGRLAEWRSFDPQEQPVADSNGWYGAKIDVDLWGRIVRWTRLGPDGQPQADDEGVMSRGIDRDSRGHRVRLQLFGVSGAPIARRDGIASWVENVDSSGHILMQRKLGLLGQPVADSNGVSGFQARYDARGNQVLWLRIGVDGRPVEARDDGIAIIVSQFDERNRLAAKYFFGAAGQPKANPDGVFGFAYRYNERGQKLETRNLAADGGLMADSDGVARMESDYDPAGGVTENRNFDAQGAPTHEKVAAIVRHRNDAYGRELERWYFDAAGRPMTSPGSGRWRTFLERDVFGRLVGEQSFGADGKPIDRKDEGWMRRTLHYGAMGRLVEVRCFNVAAELLSQCKLEE